MMGIEIHYPEEDEQASTGFTPTTVDEILLNTKIGLTLSDCAYLVGLQPPVVEKWYRDNYCNFREAVNSERVVNKKLHIGRIQTASDALKVKASSWYLERKFKEEFSKEVTVVVNHMLIDNVSHILKGLLIKYIKDPEMLRLAADEFREKVAGISTSDLPVRISNE